ncbi:MAG: zf-HC2 domain-containing protein [Myxococcota bacterium]|nr:zf-HC2 domain-containing protein [Myxococcota bacterium]
MSSSNPACKTFLPQLSPYVDGELAAGARLTLERHLSVCHDCTGRVADLRATSGLVRVGLEFATDEVDFKDFAQKVMARVTPERPPLLERWRLSLWEMFTYQRGPMMASFATAAVLLLIGVPLVLRQGTPVGYASEQMAVESVSAEAGIAPVVLTTEQGDAIIWIVDEPSKATIAGPNDDGDDEDDEEDAFRSKDPNGPRTPREGEL